MAELPSIAEDAVKKIDAKLECSICLDTYNKPKLLPCFHVFCTRCLERLVVQDRNGLSLRCPTCRQTIPLTPKGVSGLQSDFHVDHLFEIRDALEKAKISQKTQCEKCMKSTAVDFCRDCGKFICDQCKEMHKVWVEYTSHQIVSLQEVQKEAANLVQPKKQVSYCLKHSKKKLKVYCETCSELICTSCTIKLHKDHNYDLVADAFPKHKKEIVSSLQPIKKLLDTSNQALLAFEEVKNKITDQRVKTEANIHKEIDRLHQALEQRRGELISLVDKMTEKKLKNLAAQKDRAELVQVQLSSCVEYVEGRLKTVTEGEVLAMKAPVLKRIKQLTTNFEPHTIQPDDCDTVRLVAKNKVDLYQACNQFGEVLHTKTCLVKSYVSGEGTAVATEGEQTSVVLHTMDTKGAAVNEKIFPSVELVHYKSKEKYKCEIEDDQKSKYTIHYKPNSRGRHELRIAIYGNNIKGSPFTIVVAPSLQSLGKPVKVIGGIEGLRGVTTNSKDQILVVKEKSNSVSILNPDGNKIKSFGKKGSGNGEFNAPAGIAVDNDDNIYVSDRNNDRIQKFNPDGDFVQSVGTKGSGPLCFDGPNSFTFNKINGRLYVGDACNHRVQILTTDLTHHSSFGSNGSRDGQFQHPVGTAVDSKGNVYVADYNNHRVQVFTPDGKFIRKFGSKGSGPGEFNQPVGVAIDSTDTVYIAESGSNRISIFTADGDFIRSFGTKGTGEECFNRPWSIAFNSDGYMLIADSNNSRIKII